MRAAVLAARRQVPVKADRLLARLADLAGGHAGVLLSTQALAATGQLIVLVIDAAICLTAEIAS